MKYPLFPPLLSYIAGILVATCWDSRGERWFLVAVPVVISIGLIIFIASRKSWRVNLLWMLFFFVAVLNVRLRLNPEFSSNHIFHFANGTPVLLEGTLYQEPLWGDQYTRLFLRCELIRRPGGDRQVFGNADLFVPERLDYLVSGDTLILEARLKHPRNYGNPGEVDHKRQSFLRGVYVQGSIADSFHILRIGHTHTSVIYETIAHMRNHLSDLFQKVNDPAAKGLLYGLILGDRSKIPQEVLDIFQKTGLTHLLAISGFNVVLVGLFAYVCIKALLKRSLWVLLHWQVRKLAMLGSIPIIVCYVLVAGTPVTAIRALLMTLMFVGALILSRVHAIYNAVALAALFILFVDPGALFSPAFQLSFAAVLSILIWVPYLRGRLFKVYAADGDFVNPSWKTRLRRSFYELFCVSLAAIVGTAPLVAYHFHQFSLVALLSNLLIVPLLGWVVTPCALAVCFISFLNFQIADLLLKFPVWVLKGGVWMAGWLGKIPKASMHVGSPMVWEILLFYLTLLVLVWKRQFRWKGWCIASSCMVLSISLFWAWVGPRISRDLRVTFLSVGQGQSIFIEFPGGTRMLLDGGIAREGAYDAGERIVAPYLWKRRIMRIDYLVVSHAEADHYGGLGYIAENFKPTEVWTGPLMGKEEEGYDCFMALCRRKGIQHIILCEGVVPFTIQGITIRILNPEMPESMEGVSTGISGAEDPNNFSLVLQLINKDISFLFTGDIEREAEDRLAGFYGDLIASTILNVPHHGSSSSSTDGFLTKVNPRIAVVSVGYGNRFRFPSTTVLDRYRKMGIRLFRTDLDGAIQLRSNGREMIIQTFLGQEKETGVLDRR